MNISLVILILYMVALFGISWYAKKRSEGSNENFVLAGRKMSAPLIAVTIIGLAVGGASMYFTNTLKPRKTVNYAMQKPTYLPLKFQV